MAILIAGRDGTPDALRKRAARHGYSRLAPGIYAETGDDVEAGALKAWMDIVAHLYPNTCVSHRSAFRLMPEDGAIYLTRLTHNHEKRQVGGLTIYITPGNSDLGTERLTPTLKRSGDARAWLENLSSAHRRNDRNPVLPRELLEIEIEKVIGLRGVAYVKNQLAKAKDLALTLNPHGYPKLEAMVMAMIDGKDSEGILRSREGLSRAKRKPVDSHLLSLLDQLALVVSQETFAAYPATLGTQAWKNLAFIESYFSNYIEGTEFLLEEAESIVFERKIDESRHADSHDVLRVNDLLFDRDEMLRVPENPDDLLALLQNRHRFILGEREQGSPGLWKEKRNRAGDVMFVDPDKVIGTLTLGFDRYKDMPAGFARAVFIHFLISQVHPFIDGNGRVSRIFMSAEFGAADQWRIIVPTVKRDDYILGLKRARKEGDFRVMLKVFRQLQRYTMRLPWDDYGELVDVLENDNAMAKPDDGLQIFARRAKERMSQP